MIDRATADAAMAAMDSAQKAAEEADRLAGLHTRQIRNLTRAVVALAVTLAVVATVAGGALYGVITVGRDNLETAQTKGAELREKVRDTAVEADTKASGATTAAKSATRRIVRLETRIYGRGARGAAGVPGSGGTRGPAGRAPTPRELAAAVAAYCAAADCRGAAGPQGLPGPLGLPGLVGAPGRAPTPAEVADAVAAYCATRNSCRGATGSDGKPGKDGAAGADGAAGSDGAAGPGPSDEQVAEAVAAYCATNGCAPPAAVTPEPPVDPAPTTTEPETAP